MPPVIQRFEFGPWTLTTTKGHILMSHGEERDRFDKKLELPQLPEMVFGGNGLKVCHDAGFGIEFNALDALSMVDPHNDLLKVSMAMEWQAARSDNKDVKEVIKPFDWTYTTNYKGTLLGEKSKIMKVTDTSDRIDIEKLKKKEKIMFYDDVLLFDDELADNGCSILNVKVRVMPTSFFVLQRLFMRVDKVLVRINDTRLYHEAGQSHIIREFTSRDEKIENITAPAGALTDPNEIGSHLTIRTEVYEKLEFFVPDVVSPAIADIS